MDRRSFLRAGIVAGVAGLAAPGWAATGAKYLTAANKNGQDTFLLGLDDNGSVVFAIPVPSRGHAAAAHPRLPEAVAFARRPGTYAMVVDCLSGQQVAVLNSPEGRHFYGHGAFTDDGAYLLTTENDFDGPDGRLGVWDVAAGYLRVDDIPSGGLGPHEIIRLASGGFAVANGGIQTHPDYGRSKLNLPDMQTNLALLTRDGRVEQVIDGPLRQNSIRHIASDGADRVVAALQWQGPPGEVVPLLAEFSADGLRYLDHPETARLKHYAGSIAISRDGARIAVTGPKGGHMLLFDGLTGAPIEGIALDLASGVIPRGESGFAITCAKGLAHLDGAEITHNPVSGGWQFDNHLIAI